MDLPEDLGALHLLRRRVDGDVRLVRVVQEGEDAVVLLLLERIELVVVALRALNGDAEDALPDRVHPVEHGFHAELLGVDAPLLVDHRVAQKAGGDDLVLRRSGQEVARNLLDDELVVGQVAIQSADHPIAIEPDLALLVLLESVGVGVARRIQPVPPPALTVMRRRKEALHLFLVGVPAPVGKEGIDLRRRRRKSHEVQAQAPQQGHAVRGGRWRKLFLLQSSHNEMVNRIFRPSGILD